MDYATVFLVAYISAISVFVMSMAVLSIIEKGRDKYKLPPDERSK